MRYDFDHMVATPDATVTLRNRFTLVEHLVVLITAAFAMWNVDVAAVFGLVAYHAVRRVWLRL